MPDVVIVTESQWGNTAAVAAQVGAGLEASGFTVMGLSTGADPAELGTRVALLLVGGPTHAFSMSREKTRSDARERGATEPAGPGIREWIESAPVTPGVLVRTFDTRVRHFPGSAARSAAKALARRGWAEPEVGQSFFVGGYEGPLLDGELERARRWGEELAGLLPDWRKGSPSAG